MINQNSHSNKANSTFSEEATKVFMRHESTKRTSKLDCALRTESEEANIWARKGEEHLAQITQDKSAMHDLLNKATDCFEKALDANPRCIDALIYKGKIYLVRGLLDEQITLYVLDKAAEFFEKALTVDPTSVDALISMARVYLRQDLFEDATEYLKKAMNICLDVKQACVEILYERGMDHFNNGEIGRHILQNQLEKAIKCFEKILAINPEHMDAIIKIGDSYLKLGNSNDALLYANAALNLSKLESESAYKIRTEALAMRSSGNIGQYQQNLRRLRAKVTKIEGNLVLRRNTKFYGSVEVEKDIDGIGEDGTRYNIEATGYIKVGGNIRAGNIKAEEVEADNVEGIVEADVFFRKSYKELGENEVQKL